MAGVPAFLRNELGYKEPVLTIVRQPQKRGYRFRYASEGLTHGGIRGEPREGEKEGRIYPSIRLSGYRGRAKVVLTIVTANNPKELVHLHAHSLVVNREETKGYHVFDLDGSPPTLELLTIAIQHVDRKNQIPKLMDRILQSQFLQKFGWSSSIMHADAKQFADLVAFTSALRDRDGDSGSFVDRATKKEVSGDELAKLRKQATDLSKTMDMNKCRLCFQVFCQDKDGHFSRKLDPIYSDIIFDGKTTQGAQLKILRISKVTSSVSGEEEVWLMGDKLNPDDIEVRFFEEPTQGQFPHSWEGFGSFRKTDVYKQIVLIFKTPEYHDKSIEQPVNVLLELRRKSDHGCKSEPQAFKYTPIVDRYSLGEKRKKNIPMEEILAFSQTLKKQPIDPCFSSLPMNNNQMSNMFMQNMFMQNNMYNNNNNNNNNTTFMNPNQNHNVVISSSFNPISSSSTNMVFSTIGPSRNNPTVANGAYNFPTAGLISSTTFASLLTPTPSTITASSIPANINSISTTSSNHLNGVIKTEDDSMILNRTLPDALPGTLPGTLPGALPGTLPGILPGALPGAIHTQPNDVTNNVNKEAAYSNSNAVLSKFAKTGTLTESMIMELAKDNTNLMETT